MSALESQDLVDEVRDALIEKLHARFARIRDRRFAPLRVLRFRLILRKMRKAMGEK